MKAIKLSETEVIETSGIFEFSDGPVIINELEVHEFVHMNKGRPISKPRLVIDDAIERTRKFVVKARNEFGELNSLMRELQAR
ncbi:MAG TPA: hypothetical protein VJL58_03975 [Pyrinomonadaceae bacterium]|nr:hypothetical protein [Pyrinomonadaceae bacterium]